MSLNLPNSASQMAQQDQDPRTRTGWFSSLTGGQTEKTANIAEADYNRAFQSAEALKGRSFSSTEAQKARDYAERLSNTSYQRAVKDMRAAGLNPALFYAKGSGGASTPSSSAASAGGTPGGGKANPTASSTGQLAILLASLFGAGITAAGKLGAAKTAANSAQKINKYAGASKYQKIWN